MKVKAICVFFNFITDAKSFGVELHSYVPYDCNFYNDFKISILNTIIDFLKIIRHFWKLEANREQQKS